MMGYCGITIKLLENFPAFIFQKGLFVSDSSKLSKINVISGAL